MKFFVATERLLLAEPALDIDTLSRHVAWLRDEDVVRYSEQRHKSHTPTTQLDYIQTFVLPSRYIEIYIKSEDDRSHYNAIGTMTAHIDDANRVANIGIMIGEKSEWGKGYGFEAWKGLCEYFFKDGIRKIEAGCMATNLGMLGIFTKYDMTLEGTIRGHYIVNENRVTDCMLYGRFA